MVKSVDTEDLKSLHCGFESRRSYHINISLERTSGVGKLVVIGLTGKAGSGKSTAARYLERQHSFIRRPMAHRLKLMLAALGVENSVLDGALAGKETPHPALNGWAPRYAMQKLGTEWGRHCMGEDFWVDLWMRDVRKLHASIGVNRIVVDDLRFPNEVKAVMALGGIVIRVDRPGAGTTDNAAHASETGLTRLKYNATVTNGGCVDEMYAELGAIILTSGMMALT